MELTTQKLIYILPLEEEVRKNLLTNWEGMDPDVKFQTERILWDTYYAMLRLKVDKKIAMNLADVDDITTHELTSDFYNRIYEEAEKEFASENVKHSDQSELGSVRNKLEELMQLHNVS